MLLQAKQNSQWAVFLGARSPEGFLSRYRRPFHTLAWKSVLSNLNLAAALGCKGPAGGGERRYGAQWKKKKKTLPSSEKKKKPTRFFFFLLPVFLTQRGSEIIPPWAPRASDDHWTLWWMDSGLEVSCCFLIKRVFLNYATGHDGKKTVQSLLFRGSKLPKWKIGDIYLEVERL